MLIFFMFFLCSLKCNSKYVCYKMFYFTFTVLIISNNPKKKDHSFHKNIKQHNCFQNDNKKCFLSSKSAYE